MPTPPLQKEEIERRINVVKQCLKEGHPLRGKKDSPSAASVAADRLNISRSSVNQTLKAAKKHYPGLFKDIEDLEKKPEEPEAGPPPQDRTAQRLKDKLTQTTNELRKAHRELNAGEDLRRELFNLGKMTIDPPDWTIKRKKGTTGPGVPVLFFSDAQWGEVVSANELDGINEFNPEIAADRYRRMIERTIDLSFEHMVSPDYPGIIYLRGGDMISGEIHEELAETNALQAIPAVRDIVRHEAWGIRTLAEHFGKVRVISVPGNHGRTTKKAHSKHYAAHNYDTQSAWMLEDLFHAAGDKRVSFWTPESGDAVFPIYGWWFLMTHGDRIGSRGGQGFVGPAATITRGMKKLRDYYSELGRIIDYVLVGHFHTAMELEYGFSNGSLPGYSEYPRDHRMTPRPAVQWLLFVHPKHGVTARWKVALDEVPGVKRMRENLQTFDKEMF